MSKSEREKMLAGEPYLASDDELREARLRARVLVKACNDSEPTDPKRRTQLLTKLFGAIGDGAEIEPPFYCDYGVNIRIGERFFANFGCVFLDCAEVTIGDRVMLAPNVQLYTATHPLDPALRAQGLEAAKPILVLGEFRECLSLRNEEGGVDVIRQAHPEHGGFDAFIARFPAILRPAP